MSFNELISLNPKEFKAKLMFSKKQERPLVISWIISRRVQPAKLVMMLAQYIKVVVNKETKKFWKNTKMKY